MSTGMILDLLLAGLLVATIAYAAVLNRRLDSLRRAKDDMRAMVDDFAAAISKAQRGVESLRDAGDTSGRALKPLLEQGEALRDDLDFLIARGTVIADRLADDVRGARAQADVNFGARAEGGDAAARLRKILAATR